VNKTFGDKEITLKLQDGQAGVIKLVGNNQQSFKIKAQEVLKGTFLIEIQKKDIQDSNLKFKVLVYDKGKLINEIKTSFMAPAE